jgi:hypothetical protein
LPASYDTANLSLPLFDFLLTVLNRTWHSLCKTGDKNVDQEFQHDQSVPFHTKMTANPNLSRLTQGARSTVMHGDKSEALRKRRNELVKDIAMITVIFGFGWVVPFLPIFVEDLSSVTGGNVRALDFWLMWGAAGCVALKIAVSDYMRAQRDALRQGASR